MMNGFTSLVQNQGGEHHLLVYGKVAGKRPAARDGHSGVMFGDMFIVFGGDRHHMPFNDLFMLDMRTEFLTKAQVI